MIKLDKGLCQIVFYCKGWFKETNYIDDLKVLIGKRCGFNAEDVEFRDIHWHLLQIIKEYGEDKPYIYYNILAEMFKWKETITKEDMVQDLISRIRLLQVKEDNGEIIIDIGEPDYTWLPKHEH